MEQAASQIQDSRDLSLPLVIQVSCFCSTLPILYVGKVSTSSRDSRRMTALSGSVSPTRICSRQRRYQVIKADPLLPTAQMVSKTVAAEILIEPLFGAGHILEFTLLRPAFLAPESAVSQ